MRKMNTDDFFLGRSQSIRPTRSFLNELNLNGYSPEIIKKFFATGIFENEGEFTELYVGARGYTYEWGHIVEDVSSEDEEGNDFHYASWNFCFDELFTEFHEKDFFLDDLSLVFLKLLTNQNGRPCFNRLIPDYVEISSGNEASGFELIVCGIGESGLDDIRSAREWIACCFLDSILEEVLSAVKKSLRLRQI